FRRQHHRRDFARSVGPPRPFLRYHRSRPISLGGSIMDQGRIVEPGPSATRWRSAQTRLAGAPVPNHAILPVTSVLATRGTSEAVYRENGDTGYAGRFSRTAHDRAGAGARAHCRIFGIQRDRRTRGGNAAANEAESAALDAGGPANGH